MGVPDGGGEFGAVHRLEEVARGAGLKRGFDVLDVVVDAQDDDGNPGHALQELSGGVNAIPVRHGDVHEDDIGSCPGRELQDLANASAFSHHHQARVGFHQALRHASPEQGVIINQQHPHDSLAAADLRFAGHNPPLLTRSSVPVSSPTRHVRQHRRG